VEVLASKSKINCQHNEIELKEETFSTSPLQN